MTPFGLKMRQWRRQKSLTQQQQAEFLGVSKAYISALETGARGRPSSVVVDQICVWLGLIWDDAEELKRLASLSHPKPSIDVRNQTAEAVYLANLWRGISTGCQQLNASNSLTKLNGSPHPSSIL